MVKGQGQDNEKYISSMYSWKNNHILLHIAEQCKNDYALIFPWDTLPVYYGTYNITKLLIEFQYLQDGARNYN